MNTSEIATLWRKQSLQAPDIEKIALIVDAIGAEDRKFRRQIWWRDFREIAAALAVATFFLVLGRTWLSWIPSVCALFTAAYLLRSRVPQAAREESLNLAGKLQRMSDDIGTQIRLLRSILWWYLLPAAVGIAALNAEAFFLSKPRSLVIPSLLCLLLFGGVYWINQWHAVNRLEPRRQRLQNLLCELRRSES